MPASFSPGVYVAIGFGVAIALLVIILVAGCLIFWWGGFDCDEGEFDDR